MSNGGAAFVGRAAVTVARTATATSTLRPLRIGFLVDPLNRATLQRVFELNTCLWGGIFNPIIPLLKRVPTRWRDPISAARLSPMSIRRGYCEAFEPDLLVVADESDKALAEGREAYTFDEMMSKGDFDPPMLRVGTSVLGLYRELHREVFRFVLRNPPRIVEPLPQYSNLRAFVSVALGSFPVGSATQELARGWYREAFSPEAIKIDPGNYADLFLSDALWPLRAGSLRLSVRGQRRELNEGAFLMDPSSPLDLVDFWNLRALGWNMIPLPIDWKHLLHGELATEQFLGEPRHVIMVSRTIGRTGLDKALEDIQWPKDRKTALIDHYPRLVDTWGRSADRAIRPFVHHKEIETEIPIDQSGYVAIPVAKVFKEERMPLGSEPPRWATVVSVREYGSAGRSVGVVPPGITATRDILGEDADLTSEGIVFKRGGFGHHRFRLLSASAVSTAWFAQRGWTAEVSSAGRTMQHLSDALGGADGSWTILNPELIRILDRMATGLVDEEPAQDAGESSAPKGPKRPRRKKRYILATELETALAKIAAKDGRLPDLHMKALLDRGVLRLGALLECDRCGHKNWYQVSSLAEELECERCLGTTRFPSADPTRRVSWAYRPNGAFAVPDFADGSYVATAAVRFLCGHRSDEATYVPSTTLSRGKSETMELDFAMWVRERRYWRSEETYFVVGECKSYGRFMPKDFRRIRAAARAFPGAVLVFATFDADVDPVDKSKIRSIAQWGREFRGPDGWRSPVIVLTARELFSFDGAPGCWRTGPGVLKQHIERFDHSKRLEAIADRTQQMYLGMEPYGEWAHREMERKIARARGRKGGMS